MTFLDPRQRAMLAEMGVRVWAPKAAALVVPAAAAVAEQISPVRANAHVAPGTPAEQPAAPRQSAPTAREVSVPLPLAPADANPLVSGLASPPDGVEQMDWTQLEAAVATCKACGLCAGRTNTVFGVGSPRADWMVVGEAPGENEDREGEPFVGQAGKLLDNMLAAIGLARHADETVEGVVGRGKKGVYIANVLKCRPPFNRNPHADEIVQCEPYLRRQVALLRPKIILAMGRFAVQSLLKTNEPIGKLRGRVHRYEGVPVIVMYHPAYLLRSLPDKAKAWEDLCLALDVTQGGAL